VDTIAVTPTRSFEAARLVDARDAPRSPEVEHDRLLAAHRREIDPSPSVEPLQVERGRGRMPTIPESLRHAPVAVVCNPPDQQPEQAEDESKRQALRGKPSRTRHQAATMKTVVPTSTWLKSHSA